MKNYLVCNITKWRYYYLICHLRRKGAKIIQEPRRNVSKQFLLSPKKIQLELKGGPIDGMICQKKPNEHLYF